MIDRARTAIVIDPRYQSHATGHGHPERPERIGVLLPMVESLAADFTRLEARLASGQELAMVHDGAYVSTVEATQHRTQFAFDADTPTSPESYDTACLAAGGVLSLLDEIMRGGVDNGFAFVRPPGHHAERHRAMGFCLFNNVAVGAEYLRRRYGLGRILVVDWDLHHGNGTQHLFEAEPEVLYVSLHQFPYYPGSGAIDEVGRHDGEGYTVNLPFPAGCGDAEYGDAFRRIVEPIAHDYRPEFVLVSAGFDAHGRDPLGGMRVSESGFRSMTRSLMKVAAASAGGRCAAVLEGGYDLTAMTASARQVLSELRGDSDPLTDPQEPTRIAPLIEQIARQQRRYWRL